MRSNAKSPLTVWHRVLPPSGIDSVSLSKLKREAQARKLAEKKRPRELSMLADYFTNGKIGIP